jgi:hypothetical protein
LARLTFSGLWSRNRVLPLGCADQGFAAIRATALNSVISGSILAESETCSVITICTVALANVTISTFARQNLDWLGLQKPLPAHL